MAYEKLFQKGKIGSVTIRNRVVMTSMGVGLCTRFGEPSEETIRFYEDRAAEKARNFSARRGVYTSEL